MELASKLVETKNKLVFNKIVKEKWGMSEQGYKLFRERLFFDRPIAKEYKEIIGDSPDLRKRIQVDSDVEITKLYEKIDKGFRIFKDVFFDFNKEYNIDYTSFNKNKFVRGKEEVKIFKGVKKFYEDSIEELYDKEKKGFYPKDVKTNIAANRLVDVVSSVINSIQNNGNINQLRETEIALGYDEKYYSRCYGIDLDGTTFEDGNLVFSIFISNSFTRPKVKIDSVERFKKLLDVLIRIESEIIGKYKKPNKKTIELVISLNPVDWLLCSTAESWGSCLNLESNYMFYLGLPSLIGDKNRALVYLTDGTKKKYRKMEVDHFMSRSWTALVREKRTNKTYLSFTREYPNGIGLRELVKKYVPIPSFEDNYSNSYKYVSRYYVENIPFEYDGYEGWDYFMSIYIDRGSIHVAKKNKAKYMPGEYVYYKYQLEGGGGIRSFVRNRADGFITNRSVYVSDDWLREYLDDGESIMDYIMNTRGETLSQIPYID